MLRGIAGLVFVAVMSGCVSGGRPLASCNSRAENAAICGLVNPEDLAYSPDRSWIIVSEMAPIGGDVDDAENESNRGLLSAIRVENFERVVLYSDFADISVSSSDSFSRSTETWGAESCPGELTKAIFQPHGIDVGKGPAGLPAVAVVNHGGREAVELFEILPGDIPRLVWRGCVPMPPGISTNDVALLPNGGFVVTNFMPAFEGVGFKAIWTMLKISSGARTGSVLEWQPGGSVMEIENSEGSAPNGVVASADGSTLYVAEWGGESVYRLRLVDGAPPLRDEVQLDHNPDNLSWMRDGRLLVAGQHGGISASLGCGSVEGTGCDIGYSVYAIDPDSLEATKLHEGRGAASVALEMEDEFLIGFFIGDQIERVERSD